MLLDFVDSDSEQKAMYLKIYEQISEAALADELKAGERLPSIREAAAQLKVSRTTIENAYVRLCIEGIAESRPQKGYYICKKVEKQLNSYKAEKRKVKIIYNFSSQKVDTCSADISIWRKTVRSVLNDFEKLISYGDPKGEPELREALADYAFKARGVRCTSENIVIGAGVGPLLHIICGLTVGNKTIAAENGGFKQAECIFGDYGMPFTVLDSDVNGVKMQALNESKADILLMLPSQLSKISVSGINSRRREISEWVRGSANRIIIEDDYNGELRYTARSVSAFQGKDTEHIIYIGSFSKLLLPSVRIAYMVLPNSLIAEFEKRKIFYNQTCGKTEQLALTSYIKSGALEKHLRRLRKLYNRKSHILCEELSKSITAFKGYELFETSLTVKLKTKYRVPSAELCQIALSDGISIMETPNNGEVGLCFGGIDAEEIAAAVKAIDKCWIDFFDKKDI